MSASEDNAWKIEFEPPLLRRVEQVKLTRITCRVRSGEEIQRERKARNQLVFLKKEDSNYCVAVVRFNGDGSLTLNPDYKDGLYKLNYGDIPKLNQIAQKEANYLWSTNPTKNGSNSRTYKLQICDAPYKWPYGSSRRKFKPPYQSKYYYFLDVIFVNSKISKYRIRVHKQHESAWQIVN